MKIETKYELGDHIWVIYEDKGVISMYDDHIGEIAISKSKMYYVTQETVDEVYEEDIVLFGDVQGLYDYVAMKMLKIRQKEGKA